MPMSREQREEFLAGVHVGIVAIADSDGRGPVAVPVWYDYTPGGDVVFITGRESRKGLLLGRASRISLVAQTETAPYQYVMVEGPFTIEPSDVEQHLRPIARRYLGEKGGDRYVEMTAAAEAGDQSILVRLHPERWFSVDYSK